MRILVVRSYCPTKIFYGGDMRVSRFVDYFSRFADLDLWHWQSPFPEATRIMSKTFTSCYNFEPTRKGPVFGTNLFIYCPGSWRSIIHAKTRKRWMRLFLQTITILFLWVNWNPCFIFCACRKSGMTGWLLISMISFPICTPNITKIVGKRVRTAFSWG